MTALTVNFGVWAPDSVLDIAPGTQGPQLTAQTVPLTDAKNALWTAGAWRLYKPLAVTGTAYAAEPSDAITVDNSGTFETYAHASGKLYKDGTDVSKTGDYTTGESWDFQRFGDCLIATNGVDAVQDYDIGTSTAFADLAGSPPKGYSVGVVRDFVVLGNTTDSSGSHPYRVQWSAIGNPTDWPVPLTQDARAKQSGYQDNPSEYGTVQYITEGEGFGLVFQQRGIARMEYIGGDEVFSFITYERKRGLVTPRAAAQIGNLVFFLSADGFYETDGTSVKPIGYGQVDRWFLDLVYDISKVRAAVDTTKQCVYWSFPSTSGANDYVLIYNWTEGKWSYAVDTTHALFQGLSSAGHIPNAFDNTKKLGDFSGSQTGAVLETKTFRFSPGDISTALGARVIADDSADVAVAATFSDDDAVSFGSYVTRSSRSRMSSLRATGYAHAFKAKLGSGTTFAQALEVDYATRGAK